MCFSVGLRNDFLNFVAVGRWKRRFVYFGVQFLEVCGLFPVQNQLRFQFNLEIVTPVVCSAGVG